MGQRFSPNRVSPDINVVMNKYYPQYKIIKTLNNGILSKTLLVLNDIDKNPLITKVFLKHDFNDEDRLIHKHEVEKIESIQNKLFLTNNYNIAPIIKIIDDYNLGMIFRQYVKFNLKERLFLMPDLSYIEKIWLTFQLLVAVNNLVSLNLVHGDLKPENILLTSNLSVYISDFGTYKPAYILIDDITSYTYYFGSNNSADMCGCYLAPERLIEKGENKDNNKFSYMDIFSLGVIIAEIFLEKDLFDFSSLLNYKKGNKELFNIDDILIKIQNEKIRKLIYEMIKINPEERINISDALNYFSNEICPIGIKGFIFQFNAMINSTNFWKPDLIIGHLYRNWIPLWKIFYGPDSIPELLYQHLNLEIANKIILDDPFYKPNSAKSVFVSNEKNELFVDNYKLNFYPQKRNLIPELLDNKNIFKENNNKDCVFIIINYLLEAMQNCRYDSSILVAMEMIMNFSKSIDDISKLKIIIPYFMNNLREKDYIIKISSLNHIFDLFYSINYNNLILPVTEYNYFHAYIIPFLFRFCRYSELIIDFFNNLEKIIELEDIFLNITLKSRIFRLKEKIKEEENDDNNKAKGKNKQEKINKKNLITEIFSDYDNSLEEFKNSLFKIISDVIGGKNEIDLIIIVIRKLPILLELYGKNKLNDFNIFILNNFNKTSWELQKEALIQIPKMIKTFGNKYLIDYIMPCIESLISNNSNEFKIIELIKAINQFFETGYLKPNETAFYFNKLVHFYLHPNYNIRYHIIKLLKNILSKLTQEEAFIYLFESINKYIDVPLLEINMKNINKNIVKYLSRVRYQLELDNINYEIFNNYECINILPLLKDDLDLFKRGNKMANEDIINKNAEEIKSFDNDINIKNKIIYNNNYYYNSYFIQNILKDKLNTYKKYSLLSPLNKFIKKEMAKTEQSVGGTLEAKIFSRIYWISDIIENYEIPHFTNNTNFPFEDNNDNIISKDPFKITYVLKTLGISMKLVKFEELLKDTNSTSNKYKNTFQINNKNLRGNNNNNQIKKNLQEIKSIKYLNNYNYNKSFSNWRPKGQIISTLYDHKDIPVEKLISMNDNKFCSFDHEGNAIVWNIIPSDNEDIVNIKKIWDFNCQKKYRIKYKNVFASLDNLTFIIGSENSLIQYFPNRNAILNDASNKLCQSSDNSDITCVKTFGLQATENQKIIFCTRNGSINISDQRMNKVALYKNISKEKGVFNCISESFEDNNFYMGSLDGSLLYYDLRVNDIVNEYKYNENENIPILGINLYRPLKNFDYEIEHFNNNDKYIILWTGNDEHEISFWNKNNSYFYCDLLLTVNILDNEKELKPLHIEIPSLTYKQNIFNNGIENKEFLNYFNYLYRLSTMYNNSNKTKKILTSFTENDFDFYLNSNFSKISNFYENSSTVQCVSSPQELEFSNNLYSNTPYIISGGNDMTIRYWDLAKEKININRSYRYTDIDEYENKKSYIINAHNNISYCKFTKSSFDGTDILQCNEVYDSKKKKKNMNGLSEYQYFNGIAFHALSQNEFDESNQELKFCTKLADASHKGIITDLLTYNINYKDNKMNFLISSSWDGTVKIWK